jgi:hypothetical protein
MGHIASRRPSQPEDRTSRPAITWPRSSIHLPVDAEMRGTGVSGAHEHRKCLEWNASHGSSNVSRWLAVLTIIWHCRVNHGIVPRHVIAGGGLETGAASDMFVDGKEGDTRHILQTATKHACRARCAYRGLGLQNYLEVFAIVFAIYTQSANPIIADNAGIYLTPISQMDGEHAHSRGAKETLYASSDVQVGRTIPPFASGTVQHILVPPVQPHHIV